MKLSEFDNVLKINYVIKCNSDVFVGSGLNRILGNPEEIIEFEERTKSMNPRQLSMVIDKRDFVPINLPNYFLTSDGGEKYFIPGSTIKGLSRSRMEMNSIDPKCFIVQDGRVKKESTRHRNLFNLTKARYQTNTSCWICKLYGSTNRNIGRSKINFSDAVMHDGEMKQVVFKDLGTDKYIVFKEGTTLRGRITMYGLSKRQEALILQSLGMIVKHTRLVGYSKYRIKEDQDGNQIELGSVQFKLRKIQRYEANKFGHYDKVLPDLSKLRTNDEIKKAYTDARKTFKEEMKTYLKLSEDVISFDEASMVERGGLRE